MIEEIKRELKRTGRYELSMIGEVWHSQPADDHRGCADLIQLLIVQIVEQEAEAEYLRSHGTRHAWAELSDDSSTRIMMLDKACYRFGISFDSYQGWIEAHPTWRLT